MTVEVDVGPGVSADFRALPNDQLRWRALWLFSRLKENPYLGIRLKNHPTLHDLSDCRKLYLGESESVRPRWRIVYQLLPNDISPIRARIIVIWPKQEEAAYHEAARRLGRSE